MSQSSDGLEKGSSLSKSDVKYRELIKSLQDGCAQSDISKEAASFIEDCHLKLTRCLSNLSSAANMDSLLSYPIFKQLEELFVSILYRIFHSLKDDTSVDVLLLQNALRIVEIMCNTLEKIAHNLAILEEVDALQVASCLSEVVINIIYESYKHCKSSQELYGRNFSTLSSLLTDLFHKTFGLQKLLFSIINQTIVHEYLNLQSDHKTSLIEVSKRLLHISCVVGEMDKALLGSTWKLLLSFLVKFKPVLLEEIDLQPYVTEITGKVMNFLHQCNSVLDDNKDALCSGNAELQKHVTVLIRMTAFFFGLLETLLHKYTSVVDVNMQVVLVKFVSSSFEALQDFIIFVPDVGTASLPSSLRKVMATNLMSDVDKLLHFLVYTKPFQDFIFDACDDSRKSAATRLLILLRLTKVLENRSGYEFWFGKDEDHLHVCAFTSVFQLLRKLSPCFIQSSTYCLEDEDITLYEIVLRHLCAAITAVPTSLFPNLELLLFNAVAYGDPYAALMASDVWCFLAKLGAPELCLHHVGVLMETVKSFKVLGLSLQQCRLGSHLSRLFSILSTDRQAALVNQLSIHDDDDMTLWYFIGPRCCGENLLAQKVASFIYNVVGYVRNWLDIGGDLGMLPVVVIGFRVVARILVETGDDSSAINSYSKVNLGCSSLQSTVLELWKSLPTTAEHTAHCLIALYSELARITSFFITTYEDDLLMILRHANLLLSTCGDDVITESLLYNLVKMLIALRWSTLNENCLVELVALWRSVLLRSCNASWLLQHKSLQNFEVFARSTRHPSAITRICSDSNDGSRCFAASFKAHLKREISPFNGQVVRMNAFQFLSIDINWAVASDVGRSTYRKLSMIVEEIRTSVEKLKDYSEEDLNAKETSSLKDCMEILNKLLSHS